MSRRGRARTPTKVLKLRGTYRKDRHGLESDEPQFAALTELPEPPGFLDDVAQYEWHRVGPDLVEQGLLTTVDLAAFTCYCLNVARMVAAEKQINVDGMVVPGPRGPRAHPAVLIARQCGAEVRKFAQEFGLTPSARTRVRPTEKPKPKEDNPWDRVQRP